MITTSMWIIGGPRISTLEKELAYLTPLDLTTMCFEIACWNKTYNVNYCHNQQESTVIVSIPSLSEWLKGVV